MCSGRSGNRVRTTPRSLQLLLATTERTSWSRGRFETRLGSGPAAAGRRRAHRILDGPVVTHLSNAEEIVRLLVGWGATAELLYLGDDLIDVSQARLDYDLYVLKGRSDLAMSVAADLHAAGAALLNPYPVTALLRDPIVTFRVLQLAGVPVPETFVASHASQLQKLLDATPLIVKPYLRSRRQGAGVRGAAELAALGPIEEPGFAQRHPPPARPDPRRYP